MKKRFQIICVFVCFVLFAIEGFAKDNNNESHTEVAMRMIGHEILLQSGDSTSRILPVEKDANRYRIRFGTNFQFEPEKLISTVDDIILQANIANHYLVEVKDNESNNVVYSYEKGNSISTNIVPCVGRIQPEGSYFIDFTFLKPAPPFVASYSALNRPDNVIVPGQKHSRYFTVALLILTFSLLTGGLFLFFQLRGKIPAIRSNLIAIGDYKFDKRNMELLYQNKKTELTGKEAELLHLLYIQANSTIDRTIILKEVWGDDGDYVGRTLDVYISKLRKKLEADTSLKIVNIRGIGYKLIMNV